ncbi:MULTISPECIES: hypothetical protein [Loigolactobacillus]|uniref:hypothetical protein n=1 Tax=Loigolactobacillus TaxID=2767889 RepID=UPI000F736759|nr:MULTISPECIES: hypothetical protein [Loigolactobacillus]MBW4803774.1 hypothetical protein [Loigolactobacillus coryniformis subsp. torquens]MBW4806476.1 hypothetical protein [Loigolactobacillus coryniformis subsp. torquens]
MDNQFDFEGFAEVVKKAQGNGYVVRLKSDIETAAYMGKKSLIVDNHLSDESIEQLVTEGFSLTKLPGKLVINWEALE